MNGFRKIFPIFLSHDATFFAKMAERKVVPFYEFYYQLKLMYLFQKHPVYNLDILRLFSVLLFVMASFWHAGRLVYLLVSPPVKFL
jgi:hypothetical protein